MRYRDPNESFMQTGMQTEKTNRAYQKLSDQWSGLQVVQAIQQRQAAAVLRQQLPELGLPGCQLGMGVRRRLWSFLLRRGSLPLLGGLLRSVPARRGRRGGWRRGGGLGLGLGVGLRIVNRGLVILPVIRIPITLTLGSAIVIPVSIVEVHRIIFGFGIILLGWLLQLAWLRPIGGLLLRLHGFLLRNHRLWIFRLHPREATSGSRGFDWVLSTSKSGAKVGTRKDQPGVSRLGEKGTKKKAWPLQATPSDGYRGNGNFFQCPSTKPTGNQHSFGIIRECGPLQHQRTSSLGGAETRQIWD